MKKIKFKDNIELQDKITEARRGGLSIHLISQQFPEYSEITYKRFLINVKPDRPYHETPEWKSLASVSGKEGWRERSDESKQKQINHLRNLTEKQKGITPKREEEWLAKVTKWASSDEFRLKRKKTLAEKYGVDNSRAIPGVSDLIKNTLMERYGSETWFTTEKFQKQMESKSHFTSKGEKEIKEFIESLGFNPKKRKQDMVEIDVFIPELGIGIEYNGLYWHSEVHKNKSYHLDKLQYCQRNGIKLIQIFEHEWNLNKEKIKNRLKSLLGKNEVRIGARKCDIREMDLRQGIKFINDYHLQQVNKISGFAYGLFYNNELVSVALVDKHHRNGQDWVLKRFVSLPNITVSGGLSKLSKFIANKYEMLYTWCDLRWSDGLSYLSAGWIFENQLKPDYFYFRGKTVISKQSRRRKKVNTPNHLTEHEHALLNGLLRVYDCGKIKFKIVK